jgi:Zn-dependent peptidase ImmA (M78 family)
VLLEDAPDKFDGLSAFIRDFESEMIVAAAIAKKTNAGERLRLNLAHELGHLVLRIPETMGPKTEERAAFRWGAAFLAPADMIRAEVGNRRRHIDLRELMILKKRFGMSMQALVYRLRDLGVITESYCRDWFIFFNRNGWRNEEPDRIEPEEPQWLRSSVFQGLSEGWLTKRDAQQLLPGEEDQMEESLLLRERRALMKLPLEERRREMAKHSRVLADHYAEEDSSGEELISDDFLE